MSEPLPDKAGVLHYKLYGQDGQFVHLTCQDTDSMRRFTEWVRRFDRYTNGAEDTPESGERNMSMTDILSAIGTTFFVSTLSLWLVAIPFGG